MTIYKPDIADAMEQFGTQLDDLQTQERTAVIELSAINPLSELREDWQNTQSNKAEHQLSTASSTDDVAYLQTTSRGQYTSGYESQIGVGARLPSRPQNDEEVIFGYFNTDSNDSPIDGWAFGCDSTGIFVVEYKGGAENRKVYQENWNLDTVDGSGKTNKNPSGYSLSLDTGRIFQIDFLYYGYGPIVLSIITDDGRVGVHKFTHDGEVSTENTNLPISAQIDSNGTNSDALDLYIGGRQFSVIGQKSINRRRSLHYIDSIAVDDTQWHPAVTVTIKDSTDIGTIDFSHVLAEFKTFEADTDNVTYRWQVRAGTTLDTVSWETPSSHSNKQDETSVKVDTSATDITGETTGLTGVFVDGGTLEQGAKNETRIQVKDPASELSSKRKVTLILRAESGSSGTVSNISAKFKEKW